MMEPTLEETPQESGFRFSTRTLLWAVTLLGVGMGTFGLWIGVYLSLLVIVLHSILIAIRTDRKIATRLLFIVSITHLVLFPLGNLPFLLIHGDRPRPDSSWNCLKTVEILSWVLDYEVTHGHFPKPYTSDLDGNRLHSWRTLMLCKEDSGLYESIDQEKPWSEKRNLELFKASKMGRLRSPKLKDRKECLDATNYFAVVHDETVWNPKGSVKLSDITDKPESTIVLIHVLNENIPWYEPRDLSLEDAIDILVGESGSTWIRSGFFYSERMNGDGYSNRVGFADGNDRVIAPIASREIARALLTCSGGEALPVGWGDDFSACYEEVFGYIIHWGRIASALLFIFLAVLPLWKRQARRADSV